MNPWIKEVKVLVKQLDVRVDQLLAEKARYKEALVKIKSIARLHETYEEQTIYETADEVLDSFERGED